MLIEIFLGLSRARDGEVGELVMGAGGCVWRNSNSEGRERWGDFIGKWGTGNGGYG
jgi:hypothetical protein